MATMKQGILGGLSGKIGNVVGSSWKGIPVLKSLPLSVANPNTAGQQAQRGAFTKVVEAAQALLAGLITAYWNKWAEKMSGFNSFISKNIKAFDATGLVAAGNIVVGTSVSHPAHTLGISCNAATDDIDFTFIDNTGEEGALATDTAVLVAYNETTDQWYFDAVGTRRNSSPGNMPGVVQTIGDTVYGFLAFENADGVLGGTDDDQAVSA